MYYLVFQKFFSKKRCGIIFADKLGINKNINVQKNFIFFTLP